MITNILKRINLFLKENSYECMIILICAFGYILYISLYYSVEVLYLASFSGDIQFVEKFMKGSLELADIFRRFSEHGMFGYNLLLMLNAYFFHYTAHFDMVLNIINVFISGVFMIFLVKKYTISKNFIYYIGVFLISVAIFNTMQGSSTSMETQVKLGTLFFLLVAFFISQIITGVKLRKWTIFILIALIFLSINVFGTFYSFAAVPTMFLLMMILSILRKKVDRRFLLIFGTYLFAIVLYLIMYNYKPQSGSLLEGILFWILNPWIFLKAVFAYNGSAVLGYSTFVDNIISHELYLSIGFLITCTYIYSIVLFFKTKMNKVTVMPLLLHGYSFFALMLVMIGRFQWGWEWGTNYWYHIHTKFALIASIWIFTYYLTKVKKLELSFNTGLVTISILLIMGGLSLGIRNDLARAPYVREWYQNIAKYMPIDEKDMPIDGNGLTPFFVGKELTINGLEILKKYNLSVFSGK